MTQIDRYLLVIYFRVLSICFLSISGLVIVVQLFNNLTEFVELGKNSGGLLAVLLGYFGPYVLTLFDRLSGLLALMAMLFAITWIYRTHELTALLAAGVTKRRVMRPLFIASAVVILAAVVARETWIPRYQFQLERQPQELKDDVIKAVRHVRDPELGIQLRARSLSPGRQELIEPMINIYAGPLSGLGTQLVANLAKALPAEKDRPAGFHLQAVGRPRSIDAFDSIYDDSGKPLLLTAKDCSWLKPGECFLVSQIELDMLRGGSKQFASTAELIQYLRRGEVTMADEVRVQIHSRFLRPAIDWTLLLLGVPIVLSRGDRHMFWVAGVCLLVVAGFTALVMALNAVASTGYLGHILSPLLAVWLPLLTILPWGYQRTAAALDS